MGAPKESSDPVSSARRRRLVAATAAATAVLALGGCGSGFSAQTNQVYQPGIGANHRGEIDVMNTLLVANDDTSATLSASLINKTGNDESLSSITVTTLGGDELKVRANKIRLSLPPGVSTVIGSTSDPSGIRVIGGAVAGNYVKITLNFNNAAAVTIEAPVVTRTAEYDRVAG